MCGICGLLSTRAISAADLLAMNSLVRHRGPDDEGYVLFDNLSATCLSGDATAPQTMGAAFPWSPTRHLRSVAASGARLAFGHRRLSIVDLSPLGHQPMSYRDGRYWITYNGEVYNHVELREELEASGYRFLSHSDTEVILAAYDCWGIECLSRFNGMWGFALHDRQTNRLFLARDRFGVKPFYYWAAAAGQLAFSSEIKQFTALPGWQARVNGQRAYDFLVWGMIDHTDETMFSGVYQLRPGHYALLDLATWQETALAGGRLRSTPWYRLQPRKHAGTFEEAAAQFCRLLTDSVQLRIRADVPVGSCLSGGLDSSSIVCVMNGLLRRQGAQALQKTFSACSDLPRYDERAWIGAVVQATAVDAHFVVPSLEDLLRESPAVTWHQDEPFGSTSIFAQWSVFRLAAQRGVKVMLDGQGADELLAGYHGYFLPRLISLFRGLRWFALVREIAALQRLHGYPIAQAVGSLAGSTFPEPFRNLVRRGFGHGRGAPGWLDLERLGAERVNPAAEAEPGGAGDIRARSIAQLTSSSLPMLLHWEDRDSMAHSVESRVPFLDYRLVEFVLGLPDEYKLSEGVTKRVLRSGMSGVLPDSIRDRRDKMNFVTPEETWVREVAPDVFRARLAAATRASGGILKPAAGDFLEDAISGKRRYDCSVWRMINFGEWLERFSVGT